MKFNSSDIASITGGTLYGRPDNSITEVATDTRQISFTEGLIFFAFKGKNHDGHIFIDGLYNKGVKTFVVEKLPVDHKQYKKAAFILTQNSIYALQRLAAFIRKDFHYPVIAITGSAGKTVVKEWLADVLGMIQPVVRSPKSYNSQIGVPLSIIKLSDKYRMGVFEAGISMPGEMEKLEKIIQPEIGVITNIGDAHNENFPDNKIKAAEKLKLFVKSSKIIFCSDYEIIRQSIAENENLRTRDLIDWSVERKDAKIFVRKGKVADEHATISMTFKGASHDFVIPFSDRASVENAITVAAVCLAMDIPVNVISKGIRNLGAVAMRMEVKSGINNCQLVEDYYNSDPGSLGMALEFLRTRKGLEPVLILSDFVQSGRNESELYDEIAGLIAKTGIKKFIGIGDALSRNNSLFGDEAKFFHTTDDFVRTFNTSLFRNEIILIKGARVFEFEKIGKLLEQQMHQTVLEVNLDAISHNLNEFRRFLKPETRIMAMVKAFAYGAGPAEISSLLEYHRVSYLAVAYADEGVELRNSGVTLPIMVMNPDTAALDLIIKYSLEPEIYSLPSIDEFIVAASKNGLVRYPVHVKIDTGMHRLGFMPEEVGMLADKLVSQEYLQVVSVFSHLSASEDPRLDYFTHNQVKTFVKAADQIGSAVGYPFLRHILNSSGIARFPEYQFDMVRPGIGIYGIGTFKGLKLRPATSFRTRISQVKKIKGGEPVGYGCLDVSTHERDIAILPVGYADGLNRKLGNRNGELFINGHRVQIVGNICMDMCMADITGVEAEAGDEAEMFGEKIPIEEFASRCQTIPYEVLTSVPGRVKRVFFRE